MMWCGEPRLLPKPVTLPLSFCRMDEVTLRDEHQWGVRLPPELPPPKVVSL